MLGRHDAQRARGVDTQIQTQVLYLPTCLQQVSYVPTQVPKYMQLDIYMYVARYLNVHSLISLLRNGNQERQTYRGASNPQESVSGYTPFQGCPGGLRELIVSRVNKQQDQSVLTYQLFVIAMMGVHATQHLTYKVQLNVSIYLSRQVRLPSPPALPFPPPYGLHFDINSIHKKLIT